MCVFFSSIDITPFAVCVLPLCWFECVSTGATVQVLLALGVLMKLTLYLGDIMF